ncbi:neuronal acetylcholine receptor subunit alpha-9-like [Haliotis rubra]|uniref:neuronal acetylcholine receptor subunit alpha-9-like n=1 Tax=Haliotis rubra TaxID=36100 RepID=UPI001EE5901A|nr:neuronal acetylcholine receptor subunit alpha-9-like [Haliotis rubra]
MLVNVMLVLSVLPFVVPHNSSGTLKQQTFRDALLRGYPKDIPPSPSEDPNLVTVNVSFLLHYVQGLDVASQVLTVLGTLTFRWYDPLLAWNSSSHETPSHLRIKPNEIWTPPLLFSNNAGSPLESKNTLIYGFGDGHVSMTITDLFHTQCSVDVTRYPFDKQQCYIFLSAMVDYKFQAVLHESNPFAGIMGKSVEWKVENVSMLVEKLPNFCCIENVAKIVFSLSREYTFYLLTVITPVSLLSVMNACAFLLPVESGERISFLISILVTYAVFLNFVIEVLPKSGVPSRLAIYLILVFCQSCAAILTTLGLLNLYHGADDKMHSSTEATPVGMKSLPGDGDLDKLSAKVSLTETDVAKTSAGVAQ